MAKYCFKVYLTDGSSKKIVPSILDDNHTELTDIDKFVYKCGSIFELCKLLSSELEIKTEEIDKVKILRIKKEVEFSVIINNPYLASVITSTNRKKIKGYQNYEMYTMVVSKDNKSYLEMEKYLFENIEADYKFFLTEVYKYDNDFARILYRYGNTYNQGIYNEEDSRNIEELKNKIKIGLTIYKNYRGLCKSRYEYENKYFYSSKKNITPKENNIYYKEPEYKEENHQKTPLYQLNQYTNYLGEEKEEFLDIDERECEYDYGKRR